MEHVQEFYVYAIYVVADPIWWMDEIQNDAVRLSTVRYRTIKWMQPIK